EMNLIKQHRPKYNILLKDDKSYPYIKITLQEPWPRILTTRKVLDDGARYFGPYASAGAVRRLLKQLNQLFAFRPPFDCGDDKPAADIDTLDTVRRLAGVAEPVSEQPAHVE
ncbi:MAG TPA: hypothetical protein VFX76_10940, partial [Roseiflexaceae bacterium]|nr:hypothetical protein [Roseiflexaceae bacterium]